MGHSITWCAVRNSESSVFLDSLGLNPTGKIEEVPENDILVARLRSGWDILWLNSYNSNLVKDEVLSELKIDLDILVCKIEEHVMASSCEYWSSGRKKWLIAHEGENGPAGVHAEGELPEVYSKIKTDLELIQEKEGGMHADVDYIYDIPISVGKSIVGFKHDEIFEEIVEGGFRVYSQRKIGFIKRWFRL